MNSNLIFNFISKNKTIILIFKFIVYHGIVGISLHLCYNSEKTEFR